MQKDTNASATLPPTSGCVRMPAAAGAASTSTFLIHWRGRHARSSARAGNRPPRTRLARSISAAGSIPPTRATRPARSAATRGPMDSGEAVSTPPYASSALLTASIGSMAAQAPLRTGSIATADAQGVQTQAPPCSTHETPRIGGYVSTTENRMICQHVKLIASFLFGENALIVQRTLGCVKVVNPTIQEHGAAHGSTPPAKSPGEHAASAALPAARAAPANFAATTSASSDRRGLPARAHARPRLLHGHDARTIQLEPRHPLGRVAARSRSGGAGDDGRVGVLQPDRPQQGRSCAESPAEGGSRILWRRLQRR